MSFTVSSKDVTLQEIEQVINGLGNLTNSILSPYTFALIISNSGEVTFTRSGWQVLYEANYSSPIAKLIISSLKNFTNNYGEDCKYFLYIFKEFMNVICNTGGIDNALIRSKFMNELSTMKQLLPSVFEEIRSSSEIRVTDSFTFVNDLKIIVETFMCAKFPAHVSEHLTSLICNFVNGVRNEKSPLKNVLNYIVPHFDDFCSKILDNLSNSEVLKGFVICKKSAISDFNLQNSKFVIVSDLSMKSANDVSLGITNESFVGNLNLRQFYSELFTYFVKNGVKLLLTPSVADHRITLLCQTNNIHLLDRLDVEEIDQILTCIDISPLENLSDVVEPKHFGEITSSKVYYHHNSCFLNIQCANSSRLLNIHHILLAAPFNSLWKEYYFECLNCLKLIQNWVGDNSAITDSEFNPALVSKFDNELISGSHLCELKAHHHIGISLPPLQWELLFLSSLEKASEKLSLPYKTLSQKLCLVISKMICQKIDVPFCSVRNLKDAVVAFSAGTESCLEPVIHNEVIIYGILDLMVQLLKIEKIIASK